VLVPAGQDVYVSKRSGRYNLYKANVDGSQEQLVLAGTSTPSKSLATNADSTTAAVVSTADGQQALNVVTIASGATSTVDHADQIKLVDWFGTRLVYVLFKTSTSTTDTSRYQLIAYDTKSKQRTVLDHANYFNDVLSARGAVYYATSGSPSQFVKISPDGSGKQVLLASEVSAIFRSGYNDLALATVNSWYNYQIGSAKPVATNQAYQATSRLYIDSPNGSHSAWVDASGATPKLVLLDTKTGHETTLASAAGMSYPLHWLGEGTVVYRVQTGSTTPDVDYAVRTTGGDSKKLVDVNNVPGISRWHE
jgi:hypothetical protein